MVDRGVGRNVGGFIGIFDGDDVGDTIGIFVADGIGDMVDEVSKAEIKGKRLNR